MDSSSDTSDESSNDRGLSPAKYLGPPKHPDELGTLGRYRVLKQLGAGGMGAVFLGFDEALERKVALKVMLPHHAARPTAKERFKREAKAAAKVKSDHVINLYEVDEAGGVAFISMEYLQGQPLDEFLKKNGNPTIAQILRIGREVATGLADAHALGLVHRDIKPANLWLEAPKGRVKILDFGLARQQADTTQLTQSGAVVGTPAYMSPEQARGKPLDGRSDLFSLGGVLYRLCTGRLPFAGNNQMEVLTRLAMDDPTPVRSLNSSVPEPLARIVEKLLAKNPGDRYASADDVVRAIGAIESTASGTSLRSAAPIHVAAQAESVFAHLQDSSTQQADSPGLTVTRKPKAPLKKKTPWLLVGGLAAGVVVVLVAAIALFSKFQPKPEEKRPEPEIIEHKEKSPIVAKAKDLEKKDAGFAQTDPERKAASLLNLHATLTLKMADGATITTDKGSPLPAGNFVVTKVVFPAGDYPKPFVANVLIPAFADMAALEVFDDFHFHIKTTDAELSKLAGTPAAKSLTQLNLGFDLNAACLDSLRKFPKLTKFGCYGREMTDSLFEILAADHPNLVSLSLGSVKDIQAGKGLRAAARLPLGFLGLAMIRSLDPAAAKIIAEMPMLHFLNLNDSKVTDPIVRELSASRSIDLLSLSGTPITDDGLTALQGLKSLKTLEVKKTQVTAAGIAKFRAARPNVTVRWNDPEQRAAAMLAPHAILTLRMADGKSVTIEKGGSPPAGAFIISKIVLPNGVYPKMFVADTLIPAVADMAGLEELNDTFLRLSITDAEFAKLGDTSAAKSLTSLGLAFELNASTVAALRKFPKLGKCGCYGRIIDETVLEALAANSPALTELQLSIGKNIPTPKSLAALARLPFTYLYSTNAPAPDPAVVKFLVGLPKLRSLYLIDSQITDVVVRDLAVSKSITNFSLSGSPVTDECLPALRDMTSLRNLGLLRTKVTAAGIAKFKAARPDVNVEWDDPAKK
ncbi:serine/threonine-protein kinase [Zavarzinella formosa]|uniref:serine/threonine-protein kinase n=1 Tax=Zavarzinella formosa TaxID=360055 RepID=UPI0002EA2BE2|nr:serine/threonine-protein kinase [Zavarzinella formosa]